VGSFSTKTGGITRKTGLYHRQTRPKSNRLTQEESLLQLNSMNISLYFHIPFCTRRCGYCDFVTFAGFERVIPEYLSAVNLQVKQVGRGQSVHSIYFGGGTPSLVPAELYRNLFSTVRANFDVLENCEISLEANPRTVDLPLLEAYYKTGFNRISFGMQSARETELKLLERSHSPVDVELAVKAARAAGFKNINLDLIFGLPDQSLKDWQYSLESALQMNPEHLSLYSLIVEEGTPLANQIAKKTIPEPDEDIAAEQYEWSCKRLEQAGFNHYEISNWAKSDLVQDYRCQHNLQYWRLLPYLGFGAGAVGFLPPDSGYGDLANTMTNERTILKYIRDVLSKEGQSSGTHYMKQASLAFEKETRLFVGFRLLEEGIDLPTYSSRFHSEIRNDFGEIIDKLKLEQLIEIQKTNLRLTKKGWLLANRVFREFSTIEE
jgi:oxygen-independent coproporphyrinogen III oxidase